MRSRTGFVINVASCPVLWKAVLQTEVATSTMESEVVALAACCRELMPIIDMVDEVGKAVGLFFNARKPTALPTSSTINDWH